MTVSDSVMLGRCLPLEGLGSFSVLGDLICGSAVSSPKARGVATSSCLTGRPLETSLSADNSSACEMIDGLLAEPATADDAVLGARGLCAVRPPRPRPRPRPRWLLGMFDFADAGVNMTDDVCLGNALTADGVGRGWAFKTGLIAS